MLIAMAAAWCGGALATFDVKKIEASVFKIYTERKTGMGTGTGFLVNGRRVNIPSYQVRPNDVIAIKPGSPAAQVVRDATDLTASVAPWLQADHENLTGKVLKWPERAEIDTPVQESLIVELYSK